MCGAALLSKQLGTVSREERVLKKLILLLFCRVVMRSIRGRVWSNRVKLMCTRNGGRGGPRVENGDNASSLDLALIVIIIVGLAA